jgi:steroid delta-isomerase
MSPLEVFARYLDRHAANDLQAVVALFSPDAIVEDPVGSPSIQGTEAIHAFFAETHRRNGPLEIETVGPPLVCGRELAAHVRARLGSPGAHPKVDVIYLIRFDLEGRIESLRAFF